MTKFTNLTASNQSDRRLRPVWSDLLFEETTNSYLLSAERLLWYEYVDAQADPNLRRVHSLFWWIRHALTVLSAKSDGDIMFGLQIIRDL